MCVERSVATIRSSKYESNGICLGLFLLALTIIGIVTAANYVYDFDDFDAKVLSMIYVPPAAVPRFNKIAMLVIAASSACMITFHALSRFNKKLCSV
uniref:CASP-like protein n=1 Tax=Angiostrongylus cantonensis TaxID=6313 RepID=A0A0K0DIA1_ANGCA